MKYIMIDIFFGWYNTPILYLTPIQILAMVSEFIVIGRIVSKIFKKKKKLTNKYI